MKTGKKLQSGLFPLVTMTNKKWWEPIKKHKAVSKGGAIATQEQCSSGSSACNNTCGGGGR